MRQNRLLKLAILLLFIIHNMDVSGQVKKMEMSFESFKMEQNNNKIILNWTVNNGEKSNYFEVERSTDGRKFKTIMVVLGPDPSGNEEEKYEIIDKVPTKSKAYYRLKHLSKDGIITFSPIKSPGFNR